MKTKGDRQPDYSKTLVLDSSYTPRSIITTERAFVVSYKGNAQIIDNHIDENGMPIGFGLVNPKFEYFKPSIIRVFKHVKTDFHKTKLSRENIFIRDNHECIYCGDSDKKTLTLDHIIPQSKGGKDTWENLVTACKKCNNEKDNLDLMEWSGYDGKEINPKRPHYLMLMKKINYIPESWKVYLFY